MPTESEYPEGKVEINASESVLVDRVSVVKFSTSGNLQTFSALHAAFKVKLRIDNFLIDCHFVVMFFCHTRKQFCGRS